MKLHFVYPEVTVEYVSHGRWPEDVGEEGQEVSERYFCPLARIFTKRRMNIRSAVKAHIAFLQRVARIGAASSQGPRT